MSDAWHLLQDGQQYGPYTGEQLVEFVKEGRIVRESMLWAEGMAEWARADAVEGLFPPAPAPVPVAVTPSYIPGGPQPPWMRGGAAAPQARPATGMVAGVRPGMAASPYAAPRGFGVMQATPGEDYPPTDIKPAWFGLLVALVGGGGGLILLIAALVGGKIINPESGGGAALGLLLFACMIAIATGGIIQLVYLARAWRCLAYSNPRTTPGKAVFFLFIPLFNLYWYFVAFYGFPQDWNRIVSQHPDLARAPRLSEGVFLTFCIGAIAFVPLAFIMWFPMMAQICKAINFMAFRPTRHPGTFNIR